MEDGRRLSLKRIGLLMYKVHTRSLIPSCKHELFTRLVFCSVFLLSPFYLSVTINSFGKAKLFFPLGFLSQNHAVSKCIDKHGNQKGQLRNAPSRPSERASQRLKKLSTTKSGLRQRKPPRTQAIAICCHIRTVLSAIDLSVYISPNRDSWTTTIADAPEHYVRQSQPQHPTLEPYRPAHGLYKTPADSEAFRQRAISKEDKSSITRMAHHRRVTIRHTRKRHKAMCSPAMRR